MIEDAIQKAAVLIEAMPYIQAFRGETMVVKFGGSLLDDEADYADILRDIAFMEIIGLRPVVVHGGGKAISREMEKAGIAPNFVKGLRVTDADTITIVENTLNGEVNGQVCEVLERYQAHAVGIKGQDIFNVVRHSEKDPETGKQLDWGFVGEVVGVNVTPILDALKAGKVPVVTPLVPTPTVRSIISMPTSPPAPWPGNFRHANWFFFPMCPAFCAIPRTKARLFPA